MSPLSDLAGPADLKTLSDDQLSALCGDLRRTIIETVAATGGHLGSSLGVVELTVALHRVLDSPTDRIVWDTGHQAYPHKLLTGRLDRFGTLRQMGGIGGFPRRTESPHDVMDGGHAGTGLSIAEGLALARDGRGSDERIAVVVGDAALMSGLSLEALNDIGHRRTKLLIILNDNEMSISPTVGAVSNYLSRIKLSRTWRGSRRTYDDAVGRIPVVGAAVLEWSRRFRGAVVDFAQPGRLFEDLGITYIGPVRGHSLRDLDTVIRRAYRHMEGPVLLHVRTQKGHGYRPAETDQVGFHGAALPPMSGVAPHAGGANGTAPSSTATSALASAGPNVAPVSAAAPAAAAAAPSAAARPSVAAASQATPSPAAGPPAEAPNGNGNSMTGPAQQEGDAAPSAAQRAAGRKAPNYTAVMAEELIAIAREDPRVVAITAGMPTGTGLSKFQAAFPDRFYDVGIAEQHSLTLATGLALGGRRPIVALYSTFLQRAFDQLVHDVCQNDAPVVIGVDRAGLVGEDGTSHQGMFQLPAQRQLPNLIIASPADEQELRRLLRTAFGQSHPVALHYPRDAGFDLPAVDATPIPVGTGELLREGTDLLLVGLGPIVRRGLEVADLLARDGWSVAVVNARFAKPLDRNLLLQNARGKRLVVTLEESALPGGFGSAVLETIADAALGDPALRDLPVVRIGLPDDRFVDHGSVSDLRRHVRLDVPGITEQVRDAIAEVGITPLMASAHLEARPA